MNILSAVIFLLVAFSLLFGAHAAVYVSLVHFFSLTQATHKYAVASVLALLSVSFILASIAAHYYENIVTRTAYFLSGFWLGFLVNLLVAFLVLWLLTLLGGQLGFSFGSAFFGVACIGIAFLFSLSGAWAALHPGVKEIRVHIPGLPEAWRGQTIVQLSDVHLGHVYQSDFLEGIVAKVNALHPKAVVITGDLFDGMDGRLDSLVAPLRNLNTPSGVFFVTGNHETYLGVTKALAALEGTSVTFLQDEVRDVDGLELIGVSYPLRGESRDILTTLGSLRDQFIGKPNVLLYHAPVKIEEIAKSGVHLMLAGHTHRGQQFPFQFITHLVHRGYDYGLYSIGDFTLYTTSGVGTWGPSMRIGTRGEIVSITLE